MPVEACPAGQLRSLDTAGHCCWPGQVYSPSRAVCVGVPQCPAGYQALGEACQIAPSAAPSAPREPGHFQITIFGGHGLPPFEVPDTAFGIIGGLRVGYSVLGRLYLGALVLGSLQFGVHRPITVSNSTRSLRDVRAILGAGEVGIDITPGWWVIRPSLVAGYLNVVRTYDPAPPAAIDCVDHSLVVAPGLTVRAPLGVTAFLGLDARYFFEAAANLAGGDASCAADLPRVPVNPTSNTGFILNAEFGVRF